LSEPRSGPVLHADARLLFALFALSGFTGLVYESVWSHYLKLFLGSAAFAQSFVLAAFMGGMALGAWLASRWSTRVQSLLRAYGWIEGLIGIAALAFHGTFVWLTDASLERVIPALASPAAVEAYKYALCGVLILPQTILLGMTFPLMSGAVIRRHPVDAGGAPAAGHHLAMLYFTNSIGAAAGALAAAFWLIGALGMPGTMQLAGALNLLLALAVLTVARGAEPLPPLAAPAVGALPASPLLVRLFLAGAFVTGAASFIYEIAWVRMLSLVLGASFQAFELMLSAFITGLALGGLWIRKRIDRIADPVRYLGSVQVAMGLAALATLFVYHASFDWMAWALRVLQRDDAGYAPFTLFSHAIAFAVMLPATFLAGMTLPLFTHTLMRGGHGERAIGQVYAANTLGAIAGVLATVHVLLPEAGLKVTLVLGAAVDILLGAVLLRWSQAQLRRAHAFGALIAGLLAAALTARANVMPPERLSSGVFRVGQAESRDNVVLYYRDGKTATVTVSALPGGTRVISTNGKPDAAIQMDMSRPRSEDEYTMTLLGALPLLARPDAKTFANIGMGSGLTAEIVLSHTSPRALDVIEIEPSMAVGSYAFHPRVDRLFHDRRAKVHFEDAKSYFARHGKRYDVIMSEPSNPWVNGVASLFTREFYRDTARYLAPGGLFVQWLHVYELDDRLLGSMLAAMSASFADFDVYQSSAGDLVVLAVREGRVPEPQDLPASQPGFLDELAAIGITRREHLMARRIGNKRQLAPLYAQFHAPVNSDFYPVVQLEATRTRFSRRTAQAIADLANSALPVNEMLGGLPMGTLSADHASGSTDRIMQLQAALDLHGVLARGRYPAQRLAPAAALALKQPGALCGKRVSKAMLEQLHDAALQTLSHLAPQARRELWVEPRWLGCPLARAEPAVRERFAIYGAIAARDALAMHRHAAALLDDERQVDEAWGRFLLLTALLGAKASGKGAEAQRLWNAHAPALFKGPLASTDRYIADWR
jgi:predicted membrane-bound spermidine synthase